MSLESFNQGESKQERGNIEQPREKLTQEELDEKYIVHEVRESAEVQAEDDRRLAEIDEALRLMKPSKGTTIATNAADFVPVVGSGKMIMESLRGKQYGTDKEINGIGRAVHGAAGAVFLAADLTGAGAVTSVGGKALVRGSMHLAGKVAEKGVEKMAVSSTEKLAERQLLKREGGKLYERGKERRNMQDEIASDGYESGKDGQKMV